MNYQPQRPSQQLQRAQDAKELNTVILLTALIVFMTIGLMIVSL